MTRPPGRPKEGSLHPGGKARSAKDVHIWKAGSAKGAHIIAVLAGLLAFTASAGDLKLLEPERAFSFSARGLDSRTVEARFAVANGYYLYRDKLKFSIEPATLAGDPPVLPPGKIKEDEFFGKVETYRGDLVVRLPLNAPAPGTTVGVVAESQGCADQGCINGIADPLR